MTGGWRKCNEQICSVCLVEEEDELGRAHSMHVRVATGVTGVPL